MENYLRGDTRVGDSGKTGLMEFLLKICTSQKVEVGGNEELDQISSVIRYHE